METFFNYETMKHTLVLTAYMLLIMFDCWWISYLVCIFVKWVISKIKRLIAKIRKKDESKEETTNELNLHFRTGIPWSCR